ncbi:MAG: M64 family metallopeptidase [Polyangiaceae bacterium]
MSNRWRVVIAALALLVGLATTLASCAGAGDDGAVGDAQMAVEVFLGRDELAVLDVEEIDDEWAPSAEPWDGGPALAWELRDGSGSVVASGRVADDRAIHSDFDASGQAAPLQDNGGWMFIDLTLPASGGTLTVTEVPAGGGAGTSKGSQGAPQGPPAKEVAVPDLPGGKGKKEVTKSGAAIGDPVKIIDNGGCRTPLNILIVPDGFKPDQMKKFHTRAARVAKALFEFEGYKQHAGAINVWRQDIASKQSGAGDPKTGRFPNTAFGSSYGEGDLRRCLYPRDIKARTAKTLKNAKKASRADVVAILVNSTEYGGCATDGLIAQSLNEQVTAVLAHELGHGLFGLGDEYPDGECDHGRPDTPNTSHHLDDLPWARMLTVPESSLPTTSTKTPDKTIGAFVGADYCTKGAYRPQRDCLMRTLDEPFCRVCRAQFRKTVDQRAKALAKKKKNPCSVKPESLPGGGSTTMPTAGCFDGCPEGAVCSYDGVSDGGPDDGYCCKAPWTGTVACTSDADCGDGVCAEGGDGESWCTEPGAQACIDAPPVGQPNETCLGTSACTECLAASCNDTTSACLGPDWHEGQLGGPCGAFVACYCQCTGDQAECALECAPLNTGACQACMGNGYGECAASACADVCN